MTLSQKILVKVGIHALKLDIKEVSEIMDLERSRSTMQVNPIIGHNLIAWYRLESASVSLAGR